MQYRSNNSFFLLSLVLIPFVVIAETITETYEPGLILHFVPTRAKVYSKSNEEPIGTLVDANVYFGAANFEKSKSLMKYSGMNHGLLWQGYFKADKSGKYVFAARGGSVNAHCQFYSTLSSENLLSFSGAMKSSFTSKSLELKAGVHKLEAWLACSGYQRSWKENWVIIEVKRPGELEVGKFRNNELLHRK